MMKKKIRYGVVGLGYFAQMAVLPAFRHARNSELVALVSGEEEKLARLGRKYKIPHLIDYDAYDDLLKSRSIDAVYIATPNEHHLHYAIRAAEHGIHVLCEKPLAVHPREAEAMIRAARRGGVRLMVAYRLHFEPANLKAVELANRGKLGDLRFFHSSFSMAVEPGNIRAGAIEKGGGPLYDIGIYCINAARSLFQDEPVEVGAIARSHARPGIAGDDDIYSVSLRFPRERIANFVCAYGTADTGSFQLVGTKGSLELQDAYEFHGRKRLILKLGEKKREIRYGLQDQVGPELFYFSECILKNREPEPSGLEGLADLKIIDAAIKSAQYGRVVRIDSAGLGTRHPSPRQKIRRPPVREPRLVAARKPSP